MSCVRLLVLGNPRTKKNSPQGVLSKSFTGKGQKCPWCARPITQRVFPSAAWREWLKEATIEVDGVKLVTTGTGDRRVVLLWTVPVARKWVPITEPVNVAAVFYREREGPGDLVGFLQGLCDLLEERGVLENDRWVRGFDGSRLTTTNGRPRVEVELTPL